MAIYVKLEDDCEQQTDLNRSEPKIYSILLVLILLVNTGIVITIAVNNTSMENKGDSYGYDLTYKPFMILDNATTNEQSQYILPEFVDETITISEEDNYQ